MSSLLNNPNKKGHNPLDKQNDIKPQNIFTTDDLVDSTKENSKTERVTFYANVRINNHIKNKAESLASIGLFKSQKDAIDAALDVLIDSLPPDDKRRFNLQVNTLEERDVRFKK